MGVDEQVWSRGGGCAVHICRRPYEINPSVIGLVSPCNLIAHIYESLFLPWPLSATDGSGGAGPAGQALVAEVRKREDLWLFCLRAVEGSPEVTYPTVAPGGSRSFVCVRVFKSLTQCTNWIGVRLSK